MAQLFGHIYMCPQTQVKISSAAAAVRKKGKNSVTDVVHQLFVNQMYEMKDSSTDDTSHYDHLLTTAASL